MNSEDHETKVYQVIEFIHKQIRENRDGVLNERIAGRFDFVDLQENDRSDFLLGLGDIELIKTDAWEEERKYYLDDKGYQFYANAKLTEALKDNQDVNKQLKKEISDNRRVNKDLKVATLKSSATEFIFTLALITFSAIQLIEIYYNNLGNQFLLYLTSVGVGLFSSVLVVSFLISFETFKEVWKSKFDSEIDLRSSKVE
jgi:hypothetical protein